MSSSFGDSVLTEPIAYDADEEDVLVSSLEDPAKKYAELTKKAVVAKATPTIPEEEGPPSFIGSKLCYFAVCWAVLVVVVIVVASVSAAGGSSDDAAETMAPSMPEPVEVTPAPIAPEPTLPPVTDAPEVPDEIDTTDPPEETEPPVVETEPPVVETEPPVVETAAPTESPTAADVVTEPPTVATPAPTTAAPTDAPITPAPTDAPTTAAPTMMPTEKTLATILPPSSQAALEDPTSPQSFAYLFVYYDPNVDSRTDEQLVQRFALASLYFTLGRMWTNGQVLPAQSECLWFAAAGTYCNDDDQIEGLVLNDNNLEGGPIPPEIGLLTNLKVVDMSDNALTGTIPTEFGQLQVLESLSLARNGLMMGTIPTELSTIATLQTLDLSGLEFLTGVVPEGVCGAESLLFECQPDSLCGCDCECAAA